MSRRKQRGKEKVEKEIARAVATKQMSSPSRYVGAKMGNFEKTECLERNLTTVPCNLDASKYDTSNATLPRRNVPRRENR